MNYIRRTFITLLYASIFHLNTSFYNSPVTNPDNSGAKTDSTEQKRVLVVAGHGPYDGMTKNYGTIDDSLFEFDVNLETAQHLNEIINNDPRFSASTIKGLYDYSQEFKEFALKNIDRVKEDIMKENAKNKKKYKNLNLQFKNETNNLDIDSLKRYYKKHKKISTQSLNDKIMLYLERAYGEEFFDIVISVHHEYIRRLKDKNGKTLKKGEYADSGYCILINPKNKQYELTEKIARSVSEELGKIKNIGTSIFSDTRTIENKELREIIRDSLIIYGIGYRNLVMTGKNHSPMKIPAVLIEFDVLKRLNRVYVNIEEECQKNAQATYLGLLKGLDMTRLEEITKK